MTSSIFGTPSLTYKPQNDFIKKEDWTYHGEVKRGLRHGNGICRFKNGDLFSGTWEYDAFKIGEATLTFPDNSSYQGEYYQETKHGFGTYTLANGNCFHGEFENDEFLCGSIKLQTKDYTYEGMWNEGKKQGQGVQKFPNGDYKKGEWENDNLVKGYIRMTDGNELTYEGKFPA